MTTRPSERPTKQDLDLIFEKIRSQLDDLFRRHGYAPEAPVATALIRETVLALTHRWSRVRNHEQWLLDRIEKAVRRSMNPSPEEPRDDEEPPS